MVTEGIFGDQCARAVSHRSKGGGPACEPARRSVGRVWGRLTWGRQAWPSCQPHILLWPSAGVGGRAASAHGDAAGAVWPRPTPWREGEERFLSKLSRPG